MLNEMTDNEIIKTLECCKKDDCDNCPNDFGNCYANLAGYALNLINRQKAEIESLKLVNEKLYYCAKQAPIEAIKEFAERLKERAYLSREWSHGEHPYVVEVEDIDDLKEEMAGEEND